MKKENLQKIVEETLKECGKWDRKKIKEKIEEILCGVEKEFLDGKLTNKHIRDIFTSRILELFKEEEKEILEELLRKLPKEYTDEEIKAIGKSWFAHPCVGFNEAIEKVKQKIEAFKLLFEEPDEDNEDYDEISEAEAEARGRYEEAMREQDEEIARRQYEDYGPSNVRE